MPLTDPGGPLPGRAALLAASGGYAFLLVRQALTLPERVPAHVGPGNVVTRWQSLTAHLMLAAGTGVALLAMFWLLPALMGRLPVEVVNLPHKEYWRHPDRWPIARRKLADAMGWLGAATMLFIGFAFWTVGRIALADPVPEGVFWTVSVVYFVGMIGWALAQQFGNGWRPPGGVPGVR